MKKNKKIISVILALVMMLSLVSLGFTASAAPETDYTGYYKIKNAGNLAWFACLVVGDTSQSGITEAEPDAKAVLVADIDITVLASTLKKTWVGIGSEENPFTGIFDGNGYTIKGLTTDTSLTKSSVATIAVNTAKQGLFGVIGEGGVVRDVVIEGTATLSDGIQYGGICSENNGTIENVLSMVNITGGDNADVICHTNNGTITNCFTNQSTAVKDVTVVDSEALADGSVTYALGASFGQTIGEDLQPVHFNGDNAVLKVGDSYQNAAVSSITNITYIAASDTHNTFTVTVNGRPAMIQFIEEDGGTRTYFRENSNVTIRAYDEDDNEVNTLDRTIAYEVWYVYTNLIGPDVKVRAKFVEEGQYVWETATYDFTVEFAELVLDTEIYEAHMEQVTTKGPAKVVLVTGSDVQGVQFRMPNGTTATYYANKATILEDGKLEFTGNAWMNESGENTVEIYVRSQNVWSYYDSFTCTVE